MFPASASKESGENQIIRLLKKAYVMFKPSTATGGIVQNAIILSNEI